VGATKIGRGKSFWRRKEGFCDSDMSMKTFQARIYEKNLGGIDLLQKNIGYDTNITSLKQ
jgi:hypothetical protein